MPETTTNNQPTVSRSKIGVIVLMALCAGLLSWLLGERSREFAVVPLEISSKNYQYAELNAATSRVNAINGSLVFGVLGGLTCLALVLSARLIGGESGRNLRKGLAACLIGVLAGALPSFVIMPIHWMNRNNDPASLDLTRPLLYHMGLWLPIGLAAGLVFGLARGTPRQKLGGLMVSGLFGALAGTFVYEFAGAVLFPMDRTVDPIAETAQARLLAHICVPVGIALAIGFDLTKMPKARAKTVSPSV